MVFYFFYAVATLVASSSAFAQPMITLAPDGTMASNGPFAIRGNAIIHGGIQLKATEINSNEYKFPTDLSPDVSLYKVLVGTDGYAVKLPVPFVGAQIRFIHDQQKNFFIRPYTEVYSINGTIGADYYVTTANSTVDCHATSTLNWDCHNVGATTSYALSALSALTSSLSAYSYIAVTGDRTLSHADAPGSIFIDLSLGAFTLTLPACTTASAGSKWTIIVINNQNLIKFQAGSTDRIFYSSDTTQGASSFGGTVSFKTGGTLDATGKDSNGAAFPQLLCFGPNRWLLLHPSMTSSTIT